MGDSNTHEAASNVLERMGWLHACNARLHYAIKK